MATNGESCVLRAWTHCGPLGGLTWRGGAEHGFDAHRVRTWERFTPRGHILQVEADASLALRRASSTVFPCVKQPSTAGPDTAHPWPSSSHLRTTVNRGTLAVRVCVWTAQELALRRAGAWEGERRGRDRNRGASPRLWAWSASLPFGRVGGSSPLHEAATRYAMRTCGWYGGRAATWYSCKYHVVQVPNTGVRCARTVEAVAVRGAPYASEPSAASA